MPWPSDQLVWQMRTSTYNTDATERNTKRDNGQIEKHRMPDLKNPSGASHWKPLPPSHRCWQPTARQFSSSSCSPLGPYCSRKQMLATYARPWISKQFLLRDSGSLLYGATCNQIDFWELPGRFCKILAILACCYWGTIVTRKRCWVSMAG